MTHQKKDDLVINEFAINNMMKSHIEQCNTAKSIYREALNKYISYAYFAQSDDKSTADFYKMKDLKTDVENAANNFNYQVTLMKKFMSVKDNPSALKQILINGYQIDNNPETLVKYHLIYLIP